MTEPKGHTVKVRVSDPEYEQLKALAKDHGLSVSAYMRHAALGDTRSVRERGAPHGEGSKPGSAALEVPQAPGRPAGTAPRGASAPAPRQHRPIPGRLALWCLECNRRQFSDPDWRCPEHPKKTVVQRNRPYFGQEVPTPDIGLPIVDPVDAAWNALNG